MKDEKFSIRVKDEEGFPSFALVNKATGQAMKHAVGATKPVCSFIFIDQFLNNCLFDLLTQDGYDMIGWFCLLNFNTI